MDQFWYRIEELPEYPPINLEVCHVAAREKSKFGWPALGPVFFRYSRGTSPIFVLAKDWDRAVNKIVKSIDVNPAGYRRHHAWYMDVGKELRATSDRVFRAPLRKYTNGQLARLYGQLQKLVTTIHVGRVPGWVTEQRFEHFTNFILQKLQEHKRLKKLDIDAAQVFAVMSQPTQRVLINEEVESMLRLAARSGRPGLPALSAHLKKYWYLTYGLIGPGMSIHELRRRIADTRRAGQPLQVIRQRRLQRKQLIRQQHTVARVARLTRHLRQLLEVARLIGFEKSWGKEIQFYGHAAQARIGQEAGRRFGLTVRQFRWMLPREITTMLETGVRPPGKELDARWRDSGLLTNKDGMFFLRGKKLAAFLKKQRFESLPRVDTSVKILRGMPAMAGGARGVAKIINTPRDMRKMRRGDILVSHMTIPEIVPAMRLAGAVVTDMGGLTCHAAIVSRELRIPCVIGTKVATQVFKDGDKIEVDAIKGIVRKLS